MPITNLHKQHLTSSQENQILTALSDLEGAAQIIALLTQGVVLALG